MKKLNVILFLSLALFNSAWALEAPINPFTSDGCSKWPDGPAGNRTMWRECCFVHDISYWMGGPWSERLAADKALRACVKSKAGPLNGLVMYVGVRVGGRPQYQTSFRWGYGWKKNYKYQSLTPERLESVKEELDLFVGTEKEMRLVKEFRERTGI